MKNLRKGIDSADRAFRNMGGAKGKLHGAIYGVQGKKNKNTNRRIELKGILPSLITKED